jgi:alanine-glyoxylate transaminase/serine-glyoxylate transaminase/serine-pyruvate transaminase
MPVSTLYALYEGLRLAAQEGLEARWARHRRNAAMFWSGLEDLGLKPHVEVENRLTSLTTVRLPSELDEARARKRLLDEYNVEIAGGLGELKGKVWRVGLMGFSSRPENVTLLLSALWRIIDDEERRSP